MVKRVLPPPKVEVHAERPLLRRRDAAHEPEPVGAAHADVAHHLRRRGMWGLAGWRHLERPSGAGRPGTRPPRQPGAAWAVALRALCGPSG